MSKNSEHPNNFSAILDSLFKIAVEIGRHMPALLNAIKESIPLVQELIKAPSLLQPAIHRLAEEGWYLDWKGMSLQDPLRLEKLYKDGKNDEANNELIEHFRTRINEIENEIIFITPSRAHIIKQAFEAHRQGLYYASIPTFFTQVDGICKDTLGKNLFLGTKNNQKQFPQLNELDAVTKALFTPLLEKTSIRLSENERHENFDKLNRHQILHGESCDYGTEVKSLQSIACLYYVVITLHVVFYQIENYSE